MAHRDIIVMGASLGGVDALPRVVARLPRDLGAAVLIVLHMAPGAPSYLADRLDSAGSLRTAAAVDGEPITPNRIYVAVPDRHLMLEGNRIRLSRGPRESHARPSVDVLFRSAAICCGRRVIGVILTGMLDDGTAGLWAIKDRGGVAIVQSPEEAAYPSMPLSASRHVTVDHTLSLAELPDVLRALTKEEIREKEGSVVNEKLDTENRIALGDNALERGVRALGPPAFYTCPECSGSMVAIQNAPIKRYRCHTGHAFTADALADRGLPRIEQSLWAALAQLEEQEVLLRELEASACDHGDAGNAAQYAAQATDLRGLAARLRELAMDSALSRSRSHSE